jgi:hypothetical protein
MQRTILLWVWLLLMVALVVWGFVQFALAFSAAAPVWAPVALNLLTVILAWRVALNVWRKL